LLVSAIYFITRKGKNLNNQKINTKGITNKILCPNCRNKLEEGSVYCSTCGQEILKK
jgi:Zn finger protein HypA/HybF involved in hydrogenase expression